MAGKIFISYRREDVPGDARGVRDALARKFGGANVFMDVDNLLAGQRFDEEVARALAQCDVLVAVIGPRWMDLLSARAGTSERDYVREEIGAALRRGIVVIPARVGQEGRMPTLPRRDELPEDIRDLVLHQKHDLSHERFGHDIADLARAIAIVSERNRRPAPWVAATATLAVLLLAAGLGIYQKGVPASFPWSRSAPRCEVHLSARSAQSLSGVEECALKPKDTFKECADCPEMIVVPAGSFTMGSPPHETGLYTDVVREKPTHQVTFVQPFAVGKFHLTVGQFAAFATKAGHRWDARCGVRETGRWADTPGRSWLMPGFDQDGTHPVVCVSWNDAKSYAKWLADATRKPYRLLTEAEFEYAERARTLPGAYPRYFFGDNDWDLCSYGNGADQSAQAHEPGAANWAVSPCDDHFVNTSPVGTFAPNDFGLYDMFGNAWQWTEDCYNDNYVGAPSDGSARIIQGCSHRVLRGGAWDNNPPSLRSAIRFAALPSDRASTFGFRVARKVAP